MPEQKYFQENVTINILGDFKNKQIIQSESKHWTLF